MNQFKRFLPDVIAIVLFVLISFVYFLPAVSEGRILAQHDAVAGIGAGHEMQDYLEKRVSVRGGRMLFSEVCLLIRCRPATILPTR